MKVVVCVEVVLVVWQVLIEVVTPWETLDASQTPRGIDFLSGREHVR